MPEIAVHCIFLIHAGIDQMVTSSDYCREIKKLLTEVKAIFNSTRQSPAW